MASCLTQRHRGLAVLVRSYRVHVHYLIEMPITYRNRPGVPDTTLSRSKHGTCRSELARDGVKSDSNSQQVYRYREQAHSYSSNLTVVIAHDHTNATVCRHSRLNLAPPSGLVPMCKVKPCRLTIAATMDSPRPKPCF